jgi:integrase
VGIFKRNDIYWYRFNWHGERIRESTKQGNPRIARQIEAARRIELAKGDVGIRDRPRSPTLKDFAEGEFLSFVRANSSGKPRTVTFYESTVKNVLASKLGAMRMNTITAEAITEFIAARRHAGMAISTINRDLSTLRRMFRLAQEWGKVHTVLPRVRMLPGENQRERVLDAGEERRYLAATIELAYQHEESYERALEGIRAKVRGETPIQPDAYLLRDVATILLDCGLRPEECYRLKWENIRDEAVEIFAGKRRASRRRIPASRRVKSILDMRRASSGSDWIFPAATKSGHVENFTLKKQHQKAIAESKVHPFVLYDLRHTCLTRWAKVMDPFTLKKLAGHTDLNTTMRYVHLNDDDVRKAMEKTQGWAQTEHTDENTKIAAPTKLPVNH